MKNLLVVLLMALLCACNEQSSTTNTTQDNGSDDDIPNSPIPEVVTWPGQAIATDNATFTNSTFRLHVIGSGFLVVENGERPAYLRGGSFYIDGAGNVLNSATNERLLVYPPTSGDNTVFQTGLSTYLVVRGQQQINISKEGVVLARNTEGNDITLGEIIVRNFDVLRGLNAIGKALFTETADSGSPRSHEAGENNIGTLQFTTDQQADNANCSSSDYAPLFNGGFTLTGSGNGYFVLQQDNGYLLTQEIAMTANLNQIFTSSTEAVLLAYPPSGDSSFPTDTIDFLHLPERTLVATGEIEIDLSLDHGAPIIFTTFNPNSDVTFNKKTSITVYDSFGSTHSLTLYFQRQAADNWNVYALIDDKEITGSANSYVPHELTFGTDNRLMSVTLNGIDAALTANYGELSGFYPGGGADLMKLAIKYQATTTQANDVFTVSSEQNGFPQGLLVDFQITKSGVAYAKYSSGRIITLGKIATVDVTSSDNLIANDDGTWHTTDIESLHFTTINTENGEAATYERAAWPLEDQCSSQ